MLEGGEASVKRYLMTDADKERSPKDESKRLLCLRAATSIVTALSLNYQYFNGWFEYIPLCCRRKRGIAGTPLER